MCVRASPDWESVPGEEASATTIAHRPRCGRIIGMDPKNYDDKEPNLDINLWVLVVASSEQPLQR